MSLHLAADTTNYEDTFDFTEIDGYYTISLTTSSGTFYIGEQFMPISSIPTHTVIMDEIVCPQCEFPYYFQWEIFKTDSGYSIRNAESQYFLCGTGGELRTANLDAILDNPAAYPCTWNIADPASNELYMPVNLNQKYKDPNIQNFDSNTQRLFEYVSESGCMLCSLGNVVSYLFKKKYGIIDLIKENCWAISNDGTYGYVSKLPNPQDKLRWEWPTVSNEAVAVQKIKEAIDAGSPVVLHLEDTGTHWVTAYKYVNNAQSYDDIFVIDTFDMTYAQTSKWTEMEYVSEAAKRKLSDILESDKPYETYTKVTSLRIAYLK